MSSRLLHFSCRLVVLAAVAAPLLFTGGCAMFRYQKDFWNLDRYRDERAVDIDRRLDKTDPNIKNPF